MQDPDGWNDGGKRRDYGQRGEAQLVTERTCTTRYTVRWVRDWDDELEAPAASGNWPPKLAPTEWAGIGFHEVGWTKNDMGMQH
jgi:hypothetical protein